MGKATMMPAGTELSDNESSLTRKQILERFFLAEWTDRMGRLNIL